MLVVAAVPVAVASEVTVAAVAVAVSVGGAGVLVPVDGGVPVGVEVAAEGGCCGPPTAGTGVEVERGFGVGNGVTGGVGVAGRLTTIDAGVSATPTVSRIGVTFNNATSVAASARISWLSGANFWTG